MTFNPPVFINVRDRVTPLRQLVDWLQHAGHDRITLLDNASTYPPLLDYLHDCPHTVVRLGQNHGSKALWATGRVPNEQFVYTDPDVVPLAECPLDALGHLRDLLARYPRFPKAALGLHLDDVPASLSSLPWERELVKPERQLEAGVFDSLADTTLALYRPNATFDLTALRTGYPYQARHVSWYVHDRPGAEDRYYLEHALPGPQGSSWAEGSY